jgi:hypothetical protein
MLISLIDALLVNTPFFTTTVIILLVVIACLIGVIFFFDKFSKLKVYLLRILSSINTNLYLYLLPFPIIFLIYYKFYFDAQKASTLTDSLLFQPEVMDFLKNLSIIFFSGGVFSATVKLINNFVLFKKNFQKLILSDEFDSLLKDKFQILSLSDEFLLKRTDINDIWRRVTTCQFEQKFPELKTAIVKKLENDFFSVKMLTYYYHNFRFQVNIELLEDNIVKITEISNFDIIPNTKEAVNINFNIRSDTLRDDEKIYTKLIEDGCRLDGEKLNLVEEALVIEKNETVKNFTAELKGKDRYTVERMFELTQDLNEDRVFSFTSSIIIDSMFVDIRLCDKLNIMFSVVGKNKFEKDNHINAGQSYITREVLLPGEKFKIFIYKK